MRIKSFRACHPTPATVEAVNCPAYDTMNTAEAVQMADGHPDSFLHVVRPEIGATVPTEATTAACDELAATALRRLLSSGALVQEEAEALYVYRQTWRGRSQHGVVCCVHTDDYRQGVIKKHENTRTDKEDDRTRLVLHLGAQTGPVFLAYREHRSITQRILRETTGAPLYEFLVGDVLHTVWRVKSPESVQELFEDVPAAYIADGHHRAAAAARAADATAAENPDAAWFLAVLYPANELHILPVNRLVRGLNGHSPEQLLSALKALGEVTPGNSSEPPAGQAGVYLAGTWYRFSLPEPPTGATRVERLDVSRLQESVLGPLLGIADPRTDTRIDFIGGIRGTQVLADAIDREEADIAFTLNPVTVADVMDVSDQGMNMPPKSTWFEPKLRSGLFTHAFRPLDNS